MTYRLTKRAADDIRSIYASGLETFGRIQADRYHHALHDTIRLLADNPRLARLRTEILPPVRIHPFGSHLVVYRDDAFGIVVIRIRHHREDWLP